MGALAHEGGLLAIMLIGLIVAGIGALIARFRK